MRVVFWPENAMIGNEIGVRASLLLKLNAHCPITLDSVFLCIVSGIKAMRSVSSLKCAACQ